MSKPRPGELLALLREYESKLVNAGAKIPLPPVGRVSLFVKCLYCFKRFSAYQEGHVGPCCAMCVDRRRKAGEEI